MGNVLRAMKKSASRDGPPGQAVVSVISEAVARAEAAAKATLDEQATAEVLEEELDGLASEAPASTEPAEQDQRPRADDTGSQPGFAQRLNPSAFRQEVEPGPATTTSVTFVAEPCPDSAAPSKRMPSIRILRFRPSGPPGQHPRHVGSLELLEDQ